MTTVSELVKSAREQLGNRLEAEILLGHVLGRDRGWLLAHGNNACSAAATRRFDDLVRRRQAGEPVAYLTGQREFYGREFELTPAVLIPRPETELLVDLALALPLPDGAVVVDIGTGSGCIALTLALERPSWQVRAIDNSRAALAVAEINRARLGADNVTLSAGDLTGGLAGPAPQLIVSNPPYVADDDPHLRRGDVRFEPASALRSGAGGLATIQRLVEQAARVLAPGGWLLFEHGHDQAEACRRLLAGHEFSDIAGHRDLAGHERAVQARRG